jgi:hypothetical protein
MSPTRAAQGGAEDVSTIRLRERVKRKSRTWVDSIIAWMTLSRSVESYSEGDNYDSLSRRQGAPKRNKNVRNRVRQYIKATYISEQGRGREVRTRIAQNGAGKRWEWAESTNMYPDVT